MKAFRFPLDRALHVRRVRRELEQAELHRIDQEAARLRNARESLRAFGDETRAWVRTAGSFSTMPQFQRHAEMIQRRLDRQTAETKTKQAAQLRKTEEARRRVKLLEKLRARRYAEWEQEARREEERLAGEAFLARWDGLQRREPLE